MDDINFSNIRLFFKLTFSGIEKERYEGERCLLNLQRPGFSVELVKIIDDPSDFSISQAAAIYFKNYIKKNWDFPLENSRLKKEERDTIKSIIVNLFIKSTYPISETIKLAIQEICKHEFPQNWENLLPGLTANLSSPDPKTVAGSLSLMETIFERYKNTERTLKTDKELVYISNLLVAPLTEFFKRVVINFVNSSNGEEHWQILDFILGAFIGLIWQELLEDIEQSSNIWLEGLLKILEQRINNINFWSVVCIRTQTKVFKVLELFCSKYYDCAQYNEKQNAFIRITLEILSKIGEDVKFDDVAIHGISYIALVANKPYNKEVFENKQIFETIFKNLIFKNIYLRQSDIDEFEHSPEEYFRKDIDNVQTQTRRKSAFDLIQALNVYHEEKIVSIVMQCVSSLEAEYGRNQSENWMKKDAALFLIIAICIKGKTERYGVVKVANNFDVKTFLRCNVLPELTSSTNKDILKADCIKILIYFRSHIENNDFNDVINLLALLLERDCYVINTYAARAIEKFYTLKCKEGNFILNIKHIRSLCFNTLKKLFEALQKEILVGNEFVMRAITCVISRSGAELAKYTESILTSLFEICVRMLKQQTNAQFHHFLFESLAALISTTCRKNRSYLDNFEIKLFPLFKQILDSPQCENFYAYVLQLFSLMLRLRGSINNVYYSIVPLLLKPKSWLELENVKPMIILLVQFLSEPGTRLKEHLSALLGIFQKLLSQKGHEHNAFSLLIAIFEYFTIKELEPNLKHVINIACTKLEMDKSPRSTTEFCLFFCSFAALSGLDVLFECTEYVKRGLTETLIKKFVLPVARNVTDQLSRKNCALGLAAMASSPRLFRELGDDMAVALLSEAVDISELPPFFAQTVDENIYQLDYCRFSAQYSNLVFAQIKEHDSLSKLGEPAAFLAKRLQHLSKEYPNKLGKLIQDNLGEKRTKVLLAYFKDANVTLY